LLQDIVSLFFCACWYVHFRCCIKDGYCACEVCTVCLNLVVHKWPHISYMLRLKREL
jgi:hypothetical protein